MYRYFTQSSSWADINEHHNNLKPLVIDNSGIYCLFGFDTIAKTITAFNGPQIPAAATKKHLSDFLKEVLAKARMQKIEQIIFRSLGPLRKYDANIDHVFSDLGFKHQEWKTLIVDLSTSEEDLLKMFEHSARKGIKKAGSLNVNIELCGSFDKYYQDFLVPYYKNINKQLKDKEFYEHGWNLDREHVYRYWVAKSKEGQLLGSLGTYRYDSIATEIMSSLTPLAYEQKIPAQDLLHWEIIKYHKQLGDKYFDLAGFNPNPKTEKEKNIQKFKEKWGGKVYDCSSYLLDTRTFMNKLLAKFKRCVSV